MKLRATSWVVINAKDYQFDAHFGNKKLPNSPLIVLLLIIANIYLRQWFPTRDAKPLQGVQEAYVIMTGH